MKINFKSIKFRNVLSYGNKLIHYDFEHGIDLVQGANGLGKSTLQEALTYCLYGRPFRKIKIEHLINNKNNKNLYTEVKFTINKKHFKIIRGMKPNIFEIYTKKEDWEQIKKPSTNREYQHFLEENILMFNENVFRQLIVLGANLSSSKSFMDLNAKEKEEVLQVITDTAIFNKLKEALKEKRNVYRTKETEYKYKVEVVSSSLSSARINVDAMEKQNLEFNTNKSRIINKAKGDLVIKIDKLSQYQIAYDAIDVKHQQHTLNETVKAKHKLELNSITEAETRLKLDYNMFISNEENKVICPECKFEIKDALPFTSEELKLNLSEVLSKKNIAQEKYKSISLEQSSLMETISSKPRLKQNEKSLKEQITDLENNIEETNKWEEVFIDYTELKKLDKEYNENRKELIRIKSTLSDIHELEDMISDKNLKGIILNQQLPFLNKYINEFLELFDSKFNFVIDNEFNENIISRNTNNEFNSLSNGQKQRISLSILFSFLKLIEEKNGVSTNLLILDEYLDSSLDIEGINEVMAILDEVFSTHKNIILISHNPDIKNRIELLNRIVKIEMEDGFSKMNITT